MLEVATGVGFCHHCCYPRPCCRCVEASQQAPPTSWSQPKEQTLGYGVTSSSAGVGVPQSTPPMLWSQFMGQILGYGVTSSSGGTTAPSTSLGGMPGYMPPLPGISTWSMLPLGNIPSLEDMPPLEDIEALGMATAPPSRLGSCRLI